MNEAIRVVADWFEHGTHGINALLASVPRDGGDPLPANVSVYDETRDNRIARGRVPETGLPAVLVSSRTARVLDESRVTDDGFFAVDLVVQFAGKDIDAYKAKRDGNYTLRAAMWSLRRLRRQDASSASRLRNQVALIDLGPMLLDPWTEGTEDTWVVGGFVVPTTWRDYFAL